MSDELRRLLVQEIDKRASALAPGDRDAALAAAVSLKGSAGLAREVGLAASLQRLEARLRSGDSAAIPHLVALLRRAAKRLAEGSPAVADTWPQPPADLEPRTIDAYVAPSYRSEVQDRLARLDECLASDETPGQKVRVAFRHVHTLKGAASAVGDEPLGWFCHGLEERLRDATDDARAEEALATLGRVRGVLGALAEDPVGTLRRLRGEVDTPPGSGPHLADGDVERTVRVPLDVVGAMMERVDDLGALREPLDHAARRVRESARRVRAARAELASPERREAALAALALLADELDALGGDFRKHGDAFGTAFLRTKRVAAGLRTTTMATLFRRVVTVVEAEGQRLGRDVRTRAAGDDEPVDRLVAEALMEPCVQLARNSVAHGIEPPAVRRAAGKDPVGTITLSAKRTESKLMISVADDGPGVDVGRLRAHAVARGILSEERAQAESDAAILALLLRPGFSLRARADWLAGRGIGLDIAADGIERLGGTLRLMTRPGQGFSVRIELPADAGGAGEARVERLADADVAAAADIVELTGPKPEEEQRRLAAARLREELARPWSRLRVVRGPAGEVLALVVAWQVADEVHVLDVVTRASARRRGYGRLLMEELVAFARGLPIRHILLEVRRSNVPAIALYRSLGFFATNVRRRYYDDGEDALEMRLVFDELSREVRLLPDDVSLDA